MKNGICPKCGTAPVFRKLENYGYRIALDGVIGGQIARLDTYACANCGYVETYISDDRKLYYIAKMWETVPLQPEPPPDLDKTRRLPPADGKTRRL